MEEARAAKQKREPFSEIRKTVNEALAEDSTYAEAWKFLGDMAWINHDDKNQEEAYKQFVKLCPDGDADSWYRLALAQFNLKQYAEAITNFRSFLEFPKVKEENARDAEQRIIMSGLMMNPVPFNPEPLREVSTANPEYLAVISPDQEICFFTRRFEELKRGALTPVSVEKFMVSHKHNDVFDTGEPMPAPFNKSSGNNEGGASVSIDNRHLYFTVNKDGNFDIYTSTFINGKWTEPESVGATVNDPKQWDSQPSISPDGRTLYFASYRDSVKQTSDIYVSRKGADGNWGKAVPLGAPVNTDGNERTPFLHPDGLTLYFSSDKLPGMGGFDIFVCRLQKDGKWSTPENAGYPLNTEADELGFFVSTDGRKGYFASNSLRNSGYDIYSFDMPEKVKPTKVLFIKGELKDEANKTPANARIELKNTTSKETFEIDYDTLTGQYASVVQFNDDYILTVKKQGYAYNSAYFSRSDSGLAAVETVDLKMRKTEIGQAYKLNNILFTTNSATFDRQDSIIISDFAEYLKSNPPIRVSIHGHTDNEGQDAANLLLSEQRAKAVYDFLGICGIPKTRLDYKGFGAGKPVSDNATAGGRALNRRTEFVIMNK